MTRQAIQQPLRVCEQDRRQESTSEHRIHSVVIVQLCQKHGELKNAIHGAAARLNGGLYVVHHHLHVHFDSRSLAGIRFVAARMSALPGDVDQTIVNNQRSDETFAGRFAVAVEFLDGASTLRG